MKLPPPGELFDLLDLAYLVGLVALFPIASAFPSSHATVFVTGPIVLTTLMFLGQWCVTWREEALAKAGQPTGAKPGHRWGGMLLAYIVLALLSAAVSQGITNLR